MIEPKKAQTVIDLVKGRQSLTQRIDLDANYLWAALDITKEDLGVEDDNLVLEALTLPATGSPGQIVRVGGKLYRWQP